MSRLLDQNKISDFGSEKLYNGPLRALIDSQNSEESIEPLPALLQKLQLNQKIQIILKYRT